MGACGGGSSETTAQIVPRTSPTTAPTPTPPEAAATATPPPPSATASATPLPAASPAHAQAPDRRVLLAAVGDVMLARSIGARLEANGANTAFAGVSEILAGADIAFANLETAIASGGAPEPKGYTFRAPPIAADALVAAGIDLVSLANNHALDYGPEALAETQSLLSERGIRSVGAGPERARAHAPAVLAVNGLTIAVLGYVVVPIESGGFNTRRWEATESTPGVAWLEVAVMAEEVERAAADADLVVVMLHFGLEGQREPSAEQRAQARAAIDAGAAVVIGSHPHVLQEVEEYGEGLIAYSLGNFVFDGFDAPANDSAILLVELTAEGVVGHELVPVRIIDGLPHLVDESP